MVALVTTQGLTTYECTSVDVMPPTKKARCAPSRAYQRPSLSSTPIHDAPSIPSRSHGTPPTCNLSIDMLDPELIAKYDLLRTERGAFRYVQASADNTFFDVSYWNAQLHRSIPLGRFTDARMASLAHAIARADESQYDCRINPYAAQQHIVNLYTNGGQGGPAQTLASSSCDAPDHPYAAVTEAAEDMGLDIATLFTLLDDQSCSDTA